MKKSSLLKLYNFWPPFLGAGIRIRKMSDDFRHAVVTLSDRRINRNPNKTQFGGSMFMMVDPFYAMMLMHNLGPDYIVWDKAASIRFKKPGRGRLSAEFNLTQDRIDAIRHAADTQGKAEPEFSVAVKDKSGDIVAEVDKVVYVRKKPDEVEPS